jgi:predicted DNA-binding protein (UPF0278 family)
MKRIIIVREFANGKHEECLTLDKNEVDFNTYKQKVEELRKRYPESKYEIVQGIADSLEDFYKGYGRYRPR